METGDRETNKEMFDNLEAQRDEVQAMVTSDLSWERMDQRKSSRVAVYRDCDRDQLDSDPNYRQEALR